MIAKIRQHAQNLPADLGIGLDARVVSVMADIPRGAYVLPDAQDFAYADVPLDIGHGQTISQPYIVALMTTLARLTPASRVLEIGTGSGYQTAVLAALSAHVYSIEAVPALAQRAAATLQRHGLTNVTIQTADGNSGWPEQAPFHAIVVTAAPAEVPSALTDQLAPLGRLVIPVGTGRQDLRVIERLASGEFSTQSILPVRFVPLTN